MAEVSETKPANSKPSKWYLSVWFVVTLLGTFGPFALPLLWMSNRFNLIWKWILTLVVIVLTVMVTWGMWVTIELVINEFRKAGLM